MNQEIQGARRLTPIAQRLDNAGIQIRVAAVFAFVSSAITMLIALMGINAFRVFNPSELLSIDILVYTEVGVTVFMGILLLKLKSRAAAMILLLYFLINKAVMLALFDETPSWTSVLFASMYLIGVMGAFRYHKILHEIRAKAARAIAYQQSPPPEQTFLEEYPLSEYINLQDSEDQDDEGFRL